MYVDIVDVVGGGGVGVAVAVFVLLLFYILCAPHTLAHGDGTEGEYTFKYQK